MRKEITRILVGLMVIVSLPSIVEAGNNTETNILMNPELIENNLNVVELLNQIDEQKVRIYIEELTTIGPRFTGSENCEKAAEYIKNEFENMGLETTIEPWKFPQYQCQNVVAIHEGVDTTSDAVILLCAHYDTVKDSPGANDDASGIAAMLAIADLVSTYSFRHTIRFIAVSGEEVGTYGSFADAKKCYENNINILTVLNIDMIGYATEENKHIIQISGQDRSEWVLDLTQDLSEQNKDHFTIIPQKCIHYPADVESYNDYGYDGIDFVQPNPLESPGFHSPEDTIEKITFDYLINVTKLIFTVTCELANKPIAVQVKILTPYEGYIYVFDQPLVKLPAYNLYLTQIRAITYLLGKTTVKIDIDTSEVITSVYYGIDGYIRNICTHEPWEWKIGTEKLKYFSLHGHHILSVLVTTNSGETAYDEIDVYIPSLLGLLFL